MKNFSLTILLLAILLFSGRAHAEASPMILNYEEWSSLSNEDQLLYLKDLQKVVAGMDDRSEYFAQALKNTNSSRSPASADKAPKGKISPETPAVAPTDNSESIAALADSKLEKATQLLDQASKEKNPKQKYALMEKAAALTESTRYGLTMISQPTVYAASYEKWKTVRDQLTQGGSTTPSPKGSGKADPLAADIERISKVDTSFNHLLKYKQGTPEFDAARTEIRKNIGTYKTAKQEFTKGIEKSSPKDKGEFYRCMYAGFILKENCKAPSSFPKGFSLLGIKKENFACDKSQVLCNPLLFGGAASCPLDAKSNKDLIAKCLSEMKGYCTPKSSSATHDCLEEAKKGPNNLENTALLIHANPGAWDEYTNSFHSLCDEENLDKNQFTKKKGTAPRPDEDRVKKDIAQTCDWARARLLKLRKEAKIDLKKMDSSKVDAVDKKISEALDSKNETPEKTKSTLEKHDKSLKGKK